MVIGMSKDFDHEYAWHHGTRRKVAGEKGFVDGDVLERAQGLVFKIDIKNAVNQQERIAVRQLFKDVVDVHDVVESFW